MDIEPGAVVFGFLFLIFFLASIVLIARYIVTWKRDGIDSKILLTAVSIAISLGCKDQHSFLVRSLLLLRAFGIIRPNF